MRATARSTRGNCERCGYPQPFVLASGFNEDGSFRMLCGPCDRTERWRNQRQLFEMRHSWPKPVEIEPEPEPEPAKPQPQMSLF